MVLSFVIFLFYQQIRNLLKQILTSDQPLTDIIFNPSHESTRTDEAISMDAYVGSELRLDWSGASACRPEFEPRWGQNFRYPPKKNPLAVHASLVTASAMVRLWQHRPDDLSWFTQPFGVCARVRGFSRPGSYGPFL